MGRATVARAPDLLAEPIEILFLDVDGVLADGGILLAEGLELKRFAARDGAGAWIAARAGLPLVLVTYRESEAVRRRAAELDMEALQQVRDKAKAVRETCAKRKIDPAAAAFMGDDIVDLEAMRVVGLTLAPRDAAPPALRLAKIVTGAEGGQGAVREAVETILWLNRALLERKERSGARTSRARASGARTGRAHRTSRVKLRKGSHHGSS